MGREPWVQHSCKLNCVLYASLVPSLNKLLLHPEWIPVFPGGICWCKECCCPCWKQQCTAKLWHFSYLCVSGYLSSLLPVSFSGCENSEVRFKEFLELDHKRSLHCNKGGLFVCLFPTSVCMRSKVFPEILLKNFYRINLGLKGQKTIA